MTPPSACSTLSWIIFLLSMFSEFFPPVFSLAQPFCIIHIPLSASLCSCGRKTTTQVLDQGPSLLLKWGSCSIHHPVTPHDLLTPRAALLLSHSLSLAFGMLGFGGPFFWCLWIIRLVTRAPKLRFCLSKLSFLVTSLTCMNTTKRKLLVALPSHDSVFY